MTIAKQFDRFLNVSAAITLFLTMSVSGATYDWIWNAGGSRNWNDAINWSGGVPATVAGDTVRVSITPTAGPLVIDMQGNRTIENWDQGLQGFSNKNLSLSAGPGPADYVLTLAGATPTITVRGNNDRLIVDAVVAGTDGLTKAGSRTLQLNNAANTFSGGITMAGGVLVANGDSALGAASNNFLFSGSATLGFANGVYARALSLNAGALATFTNQSAVEFTGPVTGAGGIRLNPNGFGTTSLTLSSTANTFTGPVNIGFNATSNLTVNSFADSTSPITLYGGQDNAGRVARFTYGAGAVAPLVLNDRPFVLSPERSGRIQVIENANANPANTIFIGQGVSVNAASVSPLGAGSTQLTLDGANRGANTIAGPISDEGSQPLVTSLHKNGTGTWILRGNNSYTGSTTINQGLLVFGSKMALSGTGATGDSDGGVGLGSGPAGWSAAEMQSLFNANSLVGFNVPASAPIGIDTEGGDFTYPHAISGNRAFIKSGSNTLTLTGANANTGNTHVLDGTLQYGNLASFYNGNQGNWTPAKVTVESGATLAVSAGGVGEFGDGDITTLLDGGHLGGSTASAGLKPGASFGVDTSNAIGNFELSANLSDLTGGPFTLKKFGSGALSLTGTNSYTGDTDVNAGTLLINGTHTGAGAYNVAPGAILGGAGTTDAIINNLGTISPGNSIDTLTVGGFTAMGAYDWEVVDVAGSAGTGWDLIQVTGGDLDFGLIGGGTINVLPFAGIPANLDYSVVGIQSPFMQILTTTGGDILGFDVNDFVINPGSLGELGSFALSLNGTTNSLFLQFTSTVPEPGTWALMGLLVGVGLWRIRKRNAVA